MTGDKASLEDRAIELMEQMESFEQKCAQSKETLEQGKEAFKADSEALSKELVSLDNELEALQSERSTICTGVDREILSMYDRLRRYKQGIAISPVTSGVCQICHMGIPPQKFNELIRGDALMNCPHCQRIMYWGDNENFKKAEDSD
jgi:predicted  nucleic acid-binding Zn-ribbon protein